MTTDLRDELAAFHVGALANDLAFHLNERWIAADSETPFPENLAILVLELTTAVGNLAGRSSKQVQTAGDVLESCVQSVLDSYRKSWLGDDHRKRIELMARLNEEVEPEFWPYDALENTSFLASATHRKLRLSILKFARQLPSNLRTCLRLADLVNRVKTTGQMGNHAAIAGKRGPMIPLRRVYRRAKSNGLKLTEIVSRIPDCASYGVNGTFVKKVVHWATRFDAVARKRFLSTVDVPKGSPNSDKNALTATNGASADHPKRRPRKSEEMILSLFKPDVPTWRTTNQVLAELSRNGKSIPESAVKSCLAELTRYRKLVNIRPHGYGLPSWRHESPISAPTSELSVAK